MRALAGIAIVLSLLFAACPAVAGISVVEDEVIFTVRIPGAQSVYIVGDFNNWNPTVEPMSREDDTFEISLFLVPGTYRYKFVVDGRWIVDPDNPGDPEKGSFFTIEERAGGYALSTDEPEPERAAPVVQPEVRYIGDFRYEHDDDDVIHIVDLYLGFERPHLRGLVNLESSDDTWKASPPSADIDVAGMFVEATAGALSLRAFESDSAWTSRDPVTLVGRDGVFDYDTGFNRHGVAVELEPSETIVVRGVLMDRLDGTGAAMAVLDSAALAAAPDGGVLYESSERPDGADQAAVEAAIEGSDFSAGYVVRVDRGLNPGVLADVARAGSSPAATVYATREDRLASLYWASVETVYGLRLTTAYGRASSDVRLRRRGMVDLTAAADVDADAAVESVDTRRRLLDSNRFVATLRREFVAFTFDAWWDRVTFDFDAAAGSSASADVDRWGGGASWTSGRWSASVRARVTDQDYGDSPEALQIDTPVRNVWLYGEDELDIVDIAYLPHERYTDVTLRLGWASADAFLRGGRTTVVASGRGIAKKYDRIEARTELEFAYQEYYALLDGRMADYIDIDTYLTGWIEVGYRRGPVDVNVGYGFDPVVFDPVTSDYGNIGRERFLREALTPGMGRSDGALVVSRLLELERELEARSMVKLECIIRY